MMNSKLSLVRCGAVGALLVASASAQPIIIDGFYDDWTAVPVSATDPAGDNSKAFDVTQVKVLTRGTVVFIQWDTNALVNLQAGSNSNGTIRLELGFEDGDSLTIDTRALSAYRNGNPGNDVSWFSIGYASLPTAAVPVYETRIDVSGYAAPGEDVTIDFSGSDSLNSGPITVTLDQPEQAPPNPQPGDLDRAGCTDFRVLTLNTLRDGLTDPNQRDELGRIIDAFDPEIVCLQEEYDDTENDVRNRLESIDPMDDGAGWNVHKEWDNIIATPFPLIPYINGDRFATGVVDFGGGDAVFVVSMHNKCCGYAGDSNDVKRIVSMQILADIIADLRSGSLSAAMDPYANVPVLIVGDWNHVGSDTPRQLVIDPAIPGMRHWAVPGAGADSAVTWRDRDGFGFMPGLLDLVVYDTTGLTERKGFVLDTNDLAGATLTSYGLQSGDSDASDHFAIVTDFAFGSAGPADLNGDGVLDNGDINAFVLFFLAGDLGADFNGDGLLDNGDIAGFVAAFLGGC